ncbi:hypothetical protein AVEN_101868-1 [Araneus ventricosus]|uniref:Uncharacterized protein n=1 Tax=Araneus ventricosus TaxID=182803 RepID=A0A4Y2D8E9_ARAVE|nr:hypothetical protein AVEN_240670-1 [Araneus ventricosus]GBM13000.1 hypothetical protein AVEN_101868-1 [Araneus ventricosus]
MHAVLLDVTRQITEIYLTSVGEHYYIGSPTDLRRIDRRLLKFKPPHLFTRLPRSIMDRKFWKAHEWKAWLLYYAAPCLHGIPLRGTSSSGVTGFTTPRYPSV